MRLISKTILLCLILLQVIAYSNSFQDSTFSQFRTRIDSIEKKLDEQLNSTKALNKDSERNIEFSGKLIDWSAILFSSLTLILIVAGVIGLKEFSNVRKIEKDISRLKNDMEKEVNELRSIKEQILAELSTFKFEIKNDSKNLLNIIYLLNEGVRYYYSGNLPKSINTFKKVISIKNDDYEATCFLARAYSGLQQYELAIKTAQKALNLDRFPSRAYTIIGETHRRMGNVKESIESFRKAIEIENSPQILNSLAYSYFVDHNFAKANETFIQSMQLSRYSTSVCGLAKCYIMQGIHDKAKAYAQEAVLLAGEEIANSRGGFWPYYNLAAAHFILNNNNLCMDTIEKFLELNPNPSLIKEQLDQFIILKDSEIIDKNLLNDSIELLKNFLSDIR